MHITHESLEIDPASRDDSGISNIYANNNASWKKLKYLTKQNRQRKKIEILNMIL